MWKLEGTTLVNAGGLVSPTYTMSLSEGKIKNLSKNTLLGVNFDGFELEEIPSQDDLGESSLNGAYTGSPNNGSPNGAPNGSPNGAPNGAPNGVTFQTPPGQFWKPEASNRRGYFTLKNPDSGRYLTSSSFPDQLILQGIFLLIYR